MSSDALAAWLRRLEAGHPRAIDLGLVRVSEVARRLDLLQPGVPVLTVGGTNGKGSVVAMLEAGLRHAGYRVGSYTSPHLLRFNERVCLDGVPAPDAALVDAFERVEAVRGEITLTYFEFTTLAALLLFRDAALDALVLEVGLGGRLDAVNIVDADVAVITSIALDHMEYLGDTRAAIGSEKAAIGRAGRPLVCGDREPPPTVAAVAAATGARLQVLGRDFAGGLEGDGRLRFVDVRGRPHRFSPPALRGPAQTDNALAALAALDAVQPRLPTTHADRAAALAEVRLAGRLQVVGSAPLRVVDVAHNPAGGEQLASWLRGQGGAGRVHLVLGMLAHKDHAGFMRAVAAPEKDPGADLGADPETDPGTAPRAAVEAAWYLADLPGPRGASAAVLRLALQDIAPAASASCHASVADACAAALREAAPGDRIIVTGSFETAAAALRLPAFAGAGGARV